MPSRDKTNTERKRFGIGEWYGRSFVALTSQERSNYTKVASPKSQLCIPRSSSGKLVQCTKKGGVCSLRLYKEESNGNIEALSGPAVFCTLCPHRFKEASFIFEWVGQEILGHSKPIIATEVGFLLRDRQDQSDDSGNIEGDHETGAGDSSVEGHVEDEREDVGQIDYVLIHPDTSRLSWCALELQAVYFSGPAMSREYDAIRSKVDENIPFPQKNRRPDYRSSGPKRLMPQLQVKVPTLRRWGKKMAVVVDLGFFNALGRMDEVTDISNCDIVWFIVDYKEVNGKVQIIQHKVRYTTLERAVEGLTAGKPVSLKTFESRINNKLYPPQKPKRSRKGSA